MKFGIICLVTCVTMSARADDFLDRVSDALTLSTFNDNVRARLSGTLDLEYYNFEQPPPGLINSKIDNLFNPRLTFFLDAQIGSQIYFFAQSRIDRGFDPSDDSAEARLDEYALRVTPWPDGRLTFEIGKFATVVGNFVARHLSWDNPFVNAPLVYENVSAIEDRNGHVARDFAEALLFEKYDFIPVIWGPSYATGISVSGKIDKFEYAAEMKNTSLSSRPETWNVTATGFENPTVNARLGFRPNEAWNLGVSVSDGAFRRYGSNIDDFREKVLGQDISFAWRHFQAWAEFYEARFEIPALGDGDTFAWYVETKYKFTPQFFAALRWNQQLFCKIDNQTSRAVSLGEDLWRLDASAAYRFTTHTQLKLQYSFQHETSAPREDNHLFATQFTVRF